MNLKREDLQGIRVTVMGLGLHGGGIETALFFARNGARVTVTDMKSAEELASSIDRLDEFPIRFVLGGHENADFIDTDLVIKNPGVRRTSPYISMAESYGVPVMTDISVFVAMSPNPIIAVTGSKGKSTVASAIHSCISIAAPDTRLGGNITISPLSFINTIDPQTPVVLELSSWQLADLAGVRAFKPRVSVLTNLLPDHLNWYGNMDDYLADKKIIFKNQDAEDFSVFNLDDPHVGVLGGESRARPAYFTRAALPAEKTGVYIKNGCGYVRDPLGYFASDSGENATPGSNGNGSVRFPIGRAPDDVHTAIHGRNSGARGGSNDMLLFDDSVRLKGEHNRANLAAAGLACLLFGIDAGTVRAGLEAFTGIEHRLEFFLEKDGVSFYNDSAATIPHATVEALRSLPAPVCLITGGTDKNIDFSPLIEAATIAAHIILLEGNATEKIQKGLAGKGIAYDGPFPTLEAAVGRAIESVSSGGSVLFSPACASFGMFKNEFDRGRRFKACVLDMTDKTK